MTARTHKAITTTNRQSPLDRDTVRVISRLSPEEPHERLCCPGREAWHVSRAWPRRVSHPRAETGGRAAEEDEQVLKRAWPAECEP